MRRKKRNQRPLSKARRMLKRVERMTREQLRAIHALLRINGWYVDPYMKIGPEEEVWAHTEKDYCIITSKTRQIVMDDTSRVPESIRDSLEPLTRLMAGASQMKLSTRFGAYLESTDSSTTALQVVRVTKHGNSNI